MSNIIVKKDKSALAVEPTEAEKLGEIVSYLESYIQEHNIGIQTFQAALQKRYMSQGNGLHGLILEALKAAYLQGVMESQQPIAGVFRLDINVPLGLRTMVLLMKEVKFCIETAYKLGRIYGIAMQEKQSCQINLSKNTHSG